ncbi:MAG: NAD(P)/FAD-dependent oxidoreductase [Nitrososphaerales archaeon]|nr:NAD(P)/FAD-dependent oxidoreductase [Nitrososphaerales archaeon]
MKIAIIGLGVAGSYLLHTLSKEHDVKGFEMQEAGEFNAVCAWGAAKSEMQRIFERINIDFDNYVFFNGNNINLELKGKIRKVGCKGLVTYDKHQLELDLTKGLDANYGKRITPETFPSEDYDLVIDATSLQRVMLPKINDQLLVPCVEYMVEYEKLPYDDFYVKPFSTASGYFWYFPLMKNTAYVGAGDYYRKHNEELDYFNKKHGGKIIKKIGRPIRLSAPEVCQPFSKGNVVGVGEAIGTVFPLIGEGIIPSLQCAEILHRNIDNIPRYEEEVKEHFKVYSDVYKVIKLKMNNKLGPYTFIKNSGAVWSTYKTMKEQEERFGLEVRVRDMAEILLTQL